MFSLPDTAPWWAVLVVVVLALFMLGTCALVRAVWPQNSAHRKALLQERQQERARRRRELGDK